MPSEPKPKLVAMGWCDGCKANRRIMRALDTSYLRCEKCRTLYMSVQLPHNLKDEKKEEKEK